MRYEIPSPMLAKAAASVPDPAKTTGGLLFEPKWDGFRGLIAWDGETVEIGFPRSEASDQVLPRARRSDPPASPWPVPARRRDRRRHGD